MPDQRPAVPEMTRETPPDPETAAPACTAPAGPARLFVALWPPRAVAAALHRRGGAQLVDPATRPEAANRLHLTLHFLGDVPRERLPELGAALCVGFPPFELQLQAGEAWSHGLVVAVPDRPPPALADLHAALGRAVVALGLPVERRVFRPHVTLARRHPAPLAAAPPGWPPLRWPVRQFVLAESSRGKPGSYRILHRCNAY